jgi:hypothetical protein
VLALASVILADAIGRLSKSFHELRVDAVVRRVDFDARHLEALSFAPGEGFAVTCERSVALPAHVAKDASHLLFYG